MIIGSGPSVKGADLSSLPDRGALLLSGAISLIGMEIHEPLAVAIEDERFVWRHFSLMREKMMRREVPLLLSPGVIRAICELDRDFLHHRPIILIDDIRKPYGVPRRGKAELAGFDFTVLGGEAGFSSDPDRGVFQGGSVAISALQFALATGAREIGFLGVDIANADAPRFYETEGNVAFSGIVGAEARILAHIALALKVAEARGVRLSNHSQVSALKSIGLDYRPLDQTAS
ncbi:MAG: glycosyl transferase [Rhizobium sp.]|nr:glycosyl transferase [Rhizobium sp.]